MNKETFERLVAEEAALSEKMEKLKSFVNDKEKLDEVEPIERDLLVTQYSAMKTYDCALSIRINLHRSEFETQENEE